MKNQLVKIPIERIERKIYIIRGERVMLDSDLAEIYEVATKMLTRAVKRNMERFPADFLFQLSLQEYEGMRRQIGAAYDDDRSQIVTASKRNIRYLPYVFTEHGALMAANVLRSKRAVEASVQVVRAFVRLRQILASNAELAKKVEALEKKYDGQFKVVFDAIKKLMMPPNKLKGKIGFVNARKKG